MEPESEVNESRASTPKGRRRPATLRALLE
jgi:hypothetical protein